MNKPRTFAQSIIECRNLHKTFQDGRLNVQVLQGIDLSIQKGELIGIVGTSGAGKSTLLHILGGLDKPSDGQVFILDRDIHHLSERDRSSLRNKTLGFVYQFHHLLPEFTALENVSMPLLIRNESPAIAIEKAEYILEKVGLANRLHHKPSELSGGERQRTAIARALVTNPVCILADEPTGNLDYKTANRVFETMLELNREFHTSLVIVTHDPRLAIHMDKRFYLENGQIIANSDL